MEIILSEPQAEFFNSEDKSTAAVAGFGSGKTDVAMYRMVTTMLQNKKSDMLYLAPTFPLIRDIWYPKVEKFLSDIGLGCTVNRSEHTIQLQGHGKIYCRTMEHPGRIVGFEVLDAFLDELDILPVDKALEVWRKCKARCRQKCSGKQNQMFLTTTPEGFKATYELFKKNPIPGSRLIQMSTYSNLHNLPPDYIEELKANYPPQLIEAYINGQFVNLTSGRVYFSFDRKLNHLSEVEDGKEPLYIGMDFNVWNMSAIIHVYRKGLPVAVDEIGSVTDTQRMIEIIKERYGNNRRITVYPDASGASANTTNASISDISLLKQAGFSVDAPRSNPKVRDRVVAMNAMFCNALGERRYLVNTDKCKEYTEDLEQQAYDRNGEPDKAHDRDHKPDAGGYFIHRKHPAVTKPTLTVN